MMCVLEREGKLMLGEVLAGDPVTETEIRNLLQCRGTKYPTATIVHTNKHGVTDATCQLCKKAEETILHMLMYCPETEGARHCTHDSIADQLLSNIAREAEGDWVQWNRLEDPDAPEQNRAPLQDSDPPKRTGGTCGIPRHAYGLCILDPVDDPN
eukprot:3907368-Rhodomonas_salina.1